MKQVINSNKAPKAIGTYSQAVKVGNTVYLSGQIPCDPATGDIVKGDFKARVQQVFKNLVAVAEAAGSDLSSVAKFTIYITDMEKFPIVNEVMAEFCEAPYPARATVAVAALPKQTDIEIDAILTLGD